MQAVKNKSEGICWFLSIFQEPNLVDINVQQSLKLLFSLFAFNYKFSIGRGHPGPRSENKTKACNFQDKELKVFSFLSKV